MSQSLSAVPPDIASPIFRLIDARDVISLWYCGDAALQVLMRRSVTHWVEHYGHVRATLSPLIKEFPNLRYLDLYSTLGGGFRFSPDLIIAVSQKLEHLELIGPDVKALLSRKNCLDFKRVFPRLKSCNLGVIDSNWNIKFDDRLSSLPFETLISASILWKPSSWDKSFLQLLPLSQLTRLAINGMDLRDRHVRLIPPTVTHLDLNSAPDLTNDCLQLLPPGLTFLKLDRSRITSKGLSELPRRLEHLYIHCQELNYFDSNSFPSTLKSLKLVPRTPPANSLLMSLPIGLESLEVWKSDFLTSESVEAFAKKHQTPLRTLNLGTFFYKGALERCLPTRLTELNIRCHCNADLSALPLTLRKLSLEFSTNTLNLENPTWHVISQLSSLQYLCLRSGGCAYAEKQTLANEKKDEKEKMMMRRRRTVESQAEDKAVDQDQAKYREEEEEEEDGEMALKLQREIELPSSLTTLILARSPCPRLKEFPRGLTLIIAPEISDLPQHSARNWPSSLTTLRLLLDNSLTDEDLAFLPSGLEELILGENTNITNAGVAVLPRKLRIFDASSTPHLNDDCVPLLPPILEELSIRASDISPSVIERLPRRLGRLITRSDETIAAFKSNHKWASKL